MPDFPTLYPSSISFNHGSPQLSEYTAFGIGPVRFRFDDFVNGQTFTLAYENILQSDVDLIRAHYEDSSGTANEFAVPTAIFGGLSITDAFSRYRYLETPEEEHFGVYFNVTVTLQAVQGVQTNFVLNAGPATLPAEEAFSKFPFDGTMPFILDGSTAALATLVLNGD